VCQGKERLAVANITGVTLIQATVPTASCVSFAPGSWTVPSFWRYRFCCCAGLRNVRVTRPAVTLVGLRHAPFAYVLTIVI
jgi:hypothetical protein